jgi:hypothetical protein
MTHYFTFTTESWETIRTGFDSHDDIVTVEHCYIDNDGSSWTIYREEEDNIDMTEEMFLWFESKFNELIKGTWDEDAIVSHNNVMLLDESGKFGLCLSVELVKEKAIDIAEGMIRWY